MNKIAKDIDTIAKFFNGKKLLIYIVFLDITIEFYRKIEPQMTSNKGN